MRISITLKILAGYLVLAAFLVIVSLFAVRAFRDIAAYGNAGTIRKIEILSIVRHMQAGAVSLDLYERKYLERPGPDFLDLFEATRQAFDKDRRHLVELAADNPAVRTISARYQHYLTLFTEQVELLEGGHQDLARQRSVTLLRQQANRLLASLDDFAIETQGELESRLRFIASFGDRSSRVTLALLLPGSIVGLLLAIGVSRHISSSVNKLKKATHLISEGAFDFEPQISSRDEIGDLAKDLAVMARKFKGYEELCLDASPLTRLPGNIAIERALLERIRRHENFALCYVDLDDFKAFNDHYGYAQGSEVIKATGNIIFQARRLFGNREDFVGHIGGDDFVIITSPENVQPVCEEIIRQFDSEIPDFYSPEDRERGYVEGVDRYGQVRQFPIMTISIAVVSDVKRTRSSPTEIARVAAEIKEFVKELPGSNYLADRRQGRRPHR